MSNTIVEALDRIAENIQKAGGGPEDWLKEVQSGPFEEVFVRYSTGRGQVSDDGKHVVLDFKTYDLEGREDGHLDTVFEARYGDPTAILKWVKPPRGPFDKPSPVDDVLVHGFTKSTWTFGDGSSIVAVGPSLTTVALFKDGSSQLQVRLAATITGGTGRFAGALGGLTALGSTHLEKGKVFGAGTEFFGRAIECFRVIKEGDITNTERG